jgi:membrane-associated protease RseP (regulator of RpoE activity)
MAGTAGVVLFFTLLLVVILVHEFGHYALARLFGFKVQEYFVGFGPRIWSMHRGGIEYGVKALPLGGYVKIAGMNPYEPVAPEDADRAYGSKPIWQRALVIAAGPLSHAVVATVLFTVVFAQFGDVRVDATTAPAVVGNVFTSLGGASSPAAEAGIRSGDRIVSVDEVAIRTWEQLVIYVRARPEQDLVLGIERDGRPLRVTVTPVPVKTGEATIGQIGIEAGLPRMSLPSAVVAGVAHVGRSALDSFGQIGKVFGPQGVGRTFQRLFSDSPREPQDPTSVVGIGQVAATSGGAGAWGELLYLLGVVTVFIGLVNLVPLPPFDGGHLLMLVIERIRGRPVDARKLVPVSAAVMAFLVAFVLATVINDIKDPISLVQ